MGVMLGWTAFGLAVLRLVSIVIHAVYNATAKDDNLTNSSSDNALLE